VAGGTHDAHHYREQTAEAVVDALADRFPGALVENHLAQLPPSYLARTPAGIIGDHIALIERSAGGTAVEHSCPEGVDRLTIASSDRPGILSLMAGAVAAHGVNILGGTAHTRADGMAIDVMLVETSHDAADAPFWSGVCADVSRALAGTFPADAMLAAARSATRAEPAARVPTTVYIDNDASSQFSKIEVNAADRVGLLFAISRALSGLGLDIHLANVETVGNVAIDTFFVRREDGSRIETAGEIRRIQDAVAVAIAALDA
jgi:[protein-PII] uridylyltransferase